MISPEGSVPKARWDSQAKPQAVAMAANVYTIGGTRVEFPCVPYPSQVSLMNAIMSGLNGKEHCLLESPTGSGKSLALLCSTLAWQKQQYEKLANGDSEKAPGEDKSCKGSAPPQTPAPCGGGGPCNCSCHSAPGAQGGAAPSAAEAEPGSRSPYFGTSCRAPEAALPGDGGSPVSSTLTPPVTPAVGSPLASPYFLSAAPGMSRPGKRGSPADGGDKGDDDDFQVEKRRNRTPHGKALVMKRGIPKGVHYDDDSGGVSDDGAAGAKAGGVGRPRPLVTLKQNGQIPAWSPVGNTPCGAACCGCGSPGAAAGAPGSSGHCGGPDGGGVGRRPTRPPKIFFGTRTHRQITQVARELRRTAYAGTRMTVLSSREHTCVHPVVAASPHGRNEACRELLDNKNGATCLFFRNVYKLGCQAVLPSLGLASAWDVEDLVRAGRRVGACPYFSARELMEEADIVFCPYNYLIDPQIRQSMEISVRDQVVVLDEAHNMEDAAREAASASVPQDALRRARDEAGSLAAAGVRPDEHTRLQAVCISLDRWMTQSSHLLKHHDFEMDCHKLSGREMLEVLHAWGVTAHTFPELKRSLARVLEKEETVAGRGRDGGRAVSVPMPVVSAPSQVLLAALFLVLDFMFRDSSRFAEDYRVVLMRTLAWGAPDADVPDAAGFIARPRPGSRARHKRQLLTVHFWCQNPAVAFSDLSAHARTIILTSGTLSPMASFSSELGVSFTIQREATHVINSSQTNREGSLCLWHPVYPTGEVWVGTVGLGPSGRELCATYCHTETFNFQDELGELLLSVCRTVPRGVLCFLPSYKMLQKVSERWQSTGLWAGLEQRKLVMSEPQRGERAEFDRLLEVYYAAVHTEGQRDGALLLAVCRGKVSEGLDFADDNARVVLTVGIPYPNTRDLQVKLKRDYNDLHVRSRGLLPGSRWYEVQAFRALNQALGRCIRHRHDWGALLLVDARFGKNPTKYTEGLSKWLRQQVRHYADFPSGLRSLSAFTEACRATLSPADPAGPAAAGPSPGQPAVAIEPAAPLPGHGAAFDRGTAGPGRAGVALDGGGGGRATAARDPPPATPAPASGTPGGRRQRGRQRHWRGREARLGGVASIARFLSPLGGRGGAGVGAERHEATPAPWPPGSRHGLPVEGGDAAAAETGAAHVAHVATDNTATTAAGIAATTTAATTTAAGLTATTAAAAATSAPLVPAVTAVGAAAPPCRDDADVADDHRCYTPELFEPEREGAEREENPGRRFAVPTTAAAAASESNTAETAAGPAGSSVVEAEREETEAPGRGSPTSPGNDGNDGNGGLCRRVRLSKTRQRRERRESGGTGTLSWWGGAGVP